MVRPCRESLHNDGITDQKSLQRTSATKSAKSGQSAPQQNTSTLGTTQMLIIYLLEYFWKLRPITGTERHFVILREF
jgi:hypothetical protein